MRITLGVGRVRPQIMTLGILSVLGLHAFVSSAEADQRDWLIVNRSPLADGAAIYTLGAQSAGDLDGRFGVDIGTTGSGSHGVDTRVWQWGNRPTDVAWYSLALPGPFPNYDWTWDKAWIEGNVIPEENSYRIAARIGRHESFGNLVEASLQLSYALSGSGVGSDAEQTMATAPYLRLNILPTDTALTAQSYVSDTDFIWHSSVEAQQQLIKGMSLVGAVSDIGLDSQNASLRLQLYRRW